MKKTWKTFDFGSDDPKPQEKPRKTIQKPSRENGNRTATKPRESHNVKPSRHFNFHENLAPKTVAELAVNPKKVAEVEAWLKFQLKLKQNNNKATSSSFLLITGPTGSGKTSTINVLCKTLNLSITEWINPIEQDFELFRGPNQANRFIEFFSDSKWNSLFDSFSNGKVILVKDFPNAFVHKPAEFHAALEECFYKTTHPVVFICTDASHRGVHLSQTLFPQEILDKYNITQIAFNSCSATLQKAALARAKGLAQEHKDLFQIPSQSIVEAIIASSMGDIRCAINQFYLASLTGTKDLPTDQTTIHPSSGNKRKRTVKKSSTVSGMLRDEHLGLFHGIGRVLNPKPTIIDKKITFSCDIEKLVDEFVIQPSNFTLFLFENYPKYFGDLTDLSYGAASLSLSQKYLEKWYERNDMVYYAVWLAVLGLMLANKHKESKWNQIRGPKKINKQTNSFVVRGYSPMDYCYFNLIRKNNKYHEFKIVQYDDCDD